MKYLRDNNQGFTLVELLVISPILIVTVVLMMSFLFNLYGQLTQQGSQITMQNQAQTVVFSMQDDIFFASAFANDMSTSLQDAYQPSGGWTYNTTPQTLIVSTPALTKSHRDADRQPVYINTVGCDASVIQENDVLYNNIIYFVSGTNLYKRIISAPVGMNTCGTSFAQQSCPSGNTTSTCLSDRLLTDKLNSFTITYYDANNTVVTVPEQAQRIKVDLQLKDKAYAEDVYGSASISLRKVN